jgi:hypothetical protein
MPYYELWQLGITPASVIDFSATVNPYPLPEQIQRIFTCEGISAYPDTECYEARHALAAHHEIPNEWITVTAGLTEAIFTFPNLYKRAVQFSPTYGDYSRSKAGADSGPIEPRVFCSVRKMSVFSCQDRQCRAYPHEALKGTSYCGAQLRILRNAGMDSGYAGQAGTESLST